LNSARLSYALGGLSLDPHHLKHKSKSLRVFFVCKGATEATNV
jgi:hypothetical protein